MILALDVGNSQIFGGVFQEDGKLILKFRKSTSSMASSDEMGLFLRAVLRENDFDPDKLQKVAICSVVPGVMHSLRNCCVKYFDINPFILQAGTRTGLNIRYRNPQEVGSDRIANAIGAVHKFPDKNLIIADFGTATTICAITAEREYLGGLIQAGLRIAMEALEARTARLPMVEIIRPSSVVGKTTVEGIQSGIYYGGLGLLNQVIPMIKKECFDSTPTLVIATGGFSRLFEGEKMIDHFDGDLVLEGLFHALRLNL